MQNKLQLGSITEYSDILNTYGLEYTAASPYWQVGKMDKVQGWIIHLSVVVPQYQKLLELVVPELIGRNIPFKVVMSEEFGRRLMDGGLGYIQLGKMVSIYPESDMQAATLAKELIQLTSGFHGPSIPTDRLLGGIVYTRYGAFNAVELDNGQGQTFKCIYNSAGELIADPYSIPFSLPEGVAWPYGDLATPSLPKQPKLLNRRYYPFSVLKPDAKGSVIRALYFKKAWQIRICIIKQGFPHMFADAAGRDIRDRLKWQYDLYQDLRGDIPLPEVFDYFSSDGTAYLAMEFIKGIPLTTWISNIYNDRSWPILLKEEKLLLLDKLLNVLDIIGGLHKRDYVHRDITPDNFLIDKKGRLFPVDMELAWSGRKKYPDPPFRLGTPGHMSPEQIATQTPTAKEDIYGLGGMMIMFFTGMHAIKFHQHSAEAMREIIISLTGDDNLGDMVASCLHPVASQRPTILFIQNVLQQFRESHGVKVVAPNSNLSEYWKVKNTRQLVQMGIAGLAQPAFLNPKQRWISHTQKEDTYIGNEQMELTMCEGWHTGMSGVLWLVACAKNLGFQVEECLQPYRQSWDYLLTHFFPNILNKAPGLYSGAAGVAMALVEGVKAGLLNPDETFRLQLKSCFSHTSEGYSLAAGISGQGISLLNALDWLDSPFSKDLLNEYITQLLSAQLLDGSWDTGSDERRRRNTLTGLDYGIAGITWFLLSYCGRHQDDQAENAAKRALQWLSDQYKQKNGQSTWFVSTGTNIQDIWGCSNGIPGIALTFIRAYELWKEPSYKNLAEAALYIPTAAPSRMDWSLATGLSGLGEVYLEAARVFGGNEWQERSNWIAGSVATCGSRLDDTKAYWLPGYNTTATADLFTGSGGVLHFCMRHLRQKHSSHPLAV